MLLREITPAEHDVCQVSHIHEEADLVHVNWIWIWISRWFAEASETAAILPASHIGWRLLARRVSKALVFCGQAAGQWSAVDGSASPSRFRFGCRWRAAPTLDVPVLAIGDQGLQATANKRSSILGLLAWWLAVGCQTPVSRPLCSGLRGSESTWYRISSKSSTTPPATFPLHSAPALDAQPRGMTCSRPGWRRRAPCSGARAPMLAAPAARYSARMPWLDVAASSTPSRPPVDRKFALSRFWTPRADQHDAGQLSILGVVFAGPGPDAAAGTIFASPAEPIIHEAHQPPVS
jgi:hypothetical protein